MDIVELCRRIRENEPVVFVKYGDGEILCMTGATGANCDNDPYTKPLANGLIQSLAYYIQHPYSYVGRWHGEEGQQRMSWLLDQLQLSQPKWVDYHLVMNDDTAFLKPNMRTFLITVQEVHRKKIIFSNAENIRMKELFKADSYITIPPRNWFAEFEKYFELVCSEISDNCIVFTAGGQGSKVLVACLLQKYPSITCIDIGSSFDFICQKKKTRAWQHEYEDQYKYYYDRLPEGW